MGEKDERREGVKRTGEERWGERVARKGAGGDGWRRGEKRKGGERWEERGGRKDVGGEGRRGTEERDGDEKGGRKEVGGEGLEERGMGGEGWYSEQDCNKSARVTFS